MYVDKANAENGAERKPITVPSLIEMKKSGEKIAMLTAYDSSMAYQMEQAGVDVILVGDSLGMVIQGKRISKSLILFKDTQLHSPFRSMTFSITVKP
jgi:3-methyl-2-oxobutanoate hydroxymethyltransferase